MDQEHLNPAEQNQLKKGSLSGAQQGEDSEIGAGEKAKTFEENFQGHRNVHQQQRSLQVDSQSQDVQKVLEVDVPPDPQKDFMGYIQWLGKTLYKQGALLSEQPPVMSPDSEQLHAFYQKSVAAVKQKHHDFDQAADFIYDTRAKQLAAFSSLYPEMADPNIVDAVIGNELKQILHDCAKKNQNPAEVIYAIAQKIGYTNSPNTIGENFQERQNSARTLAAYNGLTPKEPISLDMLDKMSETEFNHWIADPKNKAVFNRLMGGGEF
ncbi:hypothetical protein [Bartonella koehlerae]|uniref:Phage protein n=1 Tax=Bartonella koehlerae C-29 TaxID=1134510 RepID=A0A067WIE2_9HYPH|nr:hypothetical protein [Bartonella koehlerae]KEC56533.1 hypothetical protein O9A_00027 [Bartonella koehlerae C-29]